MSDCIDTVTSLMPSSSKFDKSDVQRILDESIGPYFDDMYERIDGLSDAPFLTEADGDYLDLIHGRLYGIKRHVDEDDDDYRARLVFQARDRMTIPVLDDMGCSVYACVPDFDPTNMLTSRNTSLTTKAIVECPSDEVEQLIKDNMIWEKVVTFI